MQGVKNTNVGENHKIHFQAPEYCAQQNVKVTETLSKDNKISNKERNFGQFKGQIKIADDFDVELPDEFWLGSN